jgi:hypothetical protein
LFRDTMLSGRQRPVGLVYFVLVAGGLLPRADASAAAAEEEEQQVGVIIC